MKKINKRSTDQDYWEKILKDDGLGMGRGAPKWLSYRNNLVKTEEIEEARQTGKVRPKGPGPD